MSGFTNLVGKPCKGAFTELKKERAKRKELNVVLIGGTRGLGRCMTEKFLDHGDKVLVVGRREQAINQLRQDIANPRLHGYATDVSVADNMQPLSNYISNQIGEVDIWVNNAAQSGGHSDFRSLPNEDISSIVLTNLLACMLCCKISNDLMSQQRTGGLVLNFSGAGSNGQATPFYGAYGGTKAGIKQFTKTLQHEWKDTNVQVGLVSPGLMSTQLLFENIPDRTLEIVKPFCSTPELVAHHIVPQIRRQYYAVEQKGSIHYLTFLKTVYKSFQMLLG
jgi:short-subunit dehydrogenase